MKKHIFLGVNSARNTCCILKCLLPFDMLIPSEVEASDFSHSSTNWNGCDSIERTLELENKELTGRKIKLSKPIRFYGVDDDMGHSYSWEVNIDEIHELADKKEENTVDGTKNLVELREIAKEFLKLRAKYKMDDYSWEKAYEDIEPIVDKAYYIAQRTTSEDENLLARLLWREIKREEQDLYIKAFSDKRKTDGK